MNRTNFDEFLKAQLENPDFARRFAEAGETWEVSLQAFRLREEAGLPQTEPALWLGHRAPARSAVVNEKAPRWRARRKG